MKRYLCTALIAAVPALLQAQPVITHMHQYTTGSVMKMYQDSESQIDPGAPGANQHWMFQSLQKNDSSIISVLDPSATPFAADFPTATLALKEGSFYTYIAHSTGESLMLGTGDSMTATASPYTNPVLFALTPLNFNSTANDTFGYSNSSGSGSGDLQMTADAWGMLHLPNDTYNDVLRVKTIYNSKDTFTVGAITFTFELTAVVYRWFDDLHTSPLLVWDSTRTVSAGSPAETKTISWLASETTTGLKDIRRNLDFNATLNGTLLHINGAFESGKKYNVQLIGSDGKQCAVYRQVPGDQRMSVPVGADLAPGIYLVFLHDEQGNFGAAKLIKE